MLKRSSMPTFWKVHRKSHKFAVKPKAGAHSLATSIPLGIVLRDCLEVAENMKEAKKILSQRMVKVNGKVKRRHNLGVGFTDILELGDKKYMITMTRKGIDVAETDDNRKLCKIIDKSDRSKDMEQLVLHDGRNLLVKKDKKYRTNDTLVLDCYTKEIKDVVPLEKGNMVVVCGGENIGKIGKIEDMHKASGLRPSMVVLNIGNEKKDILFDYIFVIGKDKPLLPGVAYEHA